MNFGSPENRKPKSLRDVNLEKIVALESRIEGILSFTDGLSANDRIIIAKCRAEIAELREEIDENDSSEAETRDPQDSKDAGFESLYKEIMKMGEVEDSSGKVLTSVEIIELIKKVRSGKEEVKHVTRNRGLRERVKALL